MEIKKERQMSGASLMRVRRRSTSKGGHLFPSIIFLLGLQARDLLMKMMEVFILKFQFISECRIPEIFNKWYAVFCTKFNVNRILSSGIKQHGGRETSTNSVYG